MTWQASRVQDVSAIAAADVVVAIVVAVAGFVVA
jgi:hypothetical protein